MLKTPEHRIERLRFESDDDKASAVAARLSLLGKAAEYHLSLLPPPGAVFDDGPAALEKQYVHGLKEYSGSPADKVLGKK